MKAIQKSSRLQKYEYRAEIFAEGIFSDWYGCIGVNAIDNEYQAIKAALMNPVNSLRSE